MNHCRIVGLVFLFAAGLEWGCTQPANLPAVQEPLNSAAWRNCAGELARRESITLIDDFTLDGETLLCRGVAVAADGDVSMGLELLNESAVRLRDDYRPHYLSALILAQHHRFEEALSAYERAAKRAPSFIVPTASLGLTVQQTEGDDAAQRFLQKASDRNLCTKGCQTLLARFLQKSGKVAAAEVLFQRQIEQQPDDPQGYLGLAAIKNGSSEFAQEAKLLDQARSTEGYSRLAQGDQANLLYSLAFAYYNQADYPRAGQAIEDALVLAPDRAHWYVLAGWINARRERLEKAIDSFRRAQRLDSSLGAAFQGEGDAQTVLGQYASAQTAYEKAQTIDPKSGLIVLKLARTAALQKDYKRAQSLLDAAIALDKDRLPGELVKEITDLLPR